MSGWTVVWAQRLSVPLTRLRLSGLRASRWRLRLAHDERAVLRRCGRPGFANRFRKTPDHPVRRTSAWRRLAKRTVQAHVAQHGWHCPGWHREAHLVRPGELAADHPVALVLGGEALPARPGVLCASCNAWKGLSLRRRRGGASFERARILTILARIGGTLMGKLIYTLNVSLDGFVESVDHGLDWSVVDDELHTWFNERSRSLDAELYGRRIYELMAAYWPGVESDPSVTETEREFARIWDAMPRIVFSTSLESVRPGCRLVKGDVADRLAEIRSEFPGDLGVAGATLASAFIERGLVDEYRLVVHPVILGAGTPFFPALRDRIGLRLIETHTFGSGVVYLGYETVR